MRPPYPEHLLPQENYKKITNTLGEYYLVRQITIENNLGDDNKATAFNASHWHEGLSTSLLSEYTISDVDFFVSGKDEPDCIKEWEDEEGQRQYPNGLMPNKYDYVKDRKCVIVKISDLLNFELENQTFSVKGIPVKKYENADLFITVEHAPTNCNFWHFNILLNGRGKLKNKEQIDEYEFSKRKDTIGSGQVEKLVKNVILGELEPLILSPKENINIQDIPKEFYMN